MGGGFRRLLSPAARRRRNPNPSPPSWGGLRAAARRGGTKPPVARAASCRVARALGRVRGRGASGPPSGGRGQPKENHGRAPDRGPPPPRRRAAGGAPAGGGRVRRRRGTDAGQAANPTPRRPQPAAGPRGPGAAAYGAGAIPPGRGAASAAKKCREACPPAGQRLDEKNCGEDALSPPLAVTADTRYPPVRRSSPKRTRCRPVPYALVMRLSPGLRSCVP